MRTDIVVTRGKTSLEEHGWSEFKECSIIRDSYGKTRVRAYMERDGNHVDIDCSASGVDPYLFRDFMEARMKRGLPFEIILVQGVTFSMVWRRRYRGDGRIG